MFKQWIKRMNCPHIWSNELAVSYFGWRINRLHICIKCGKFTATTNTPMPMDVGEVEMVGNIIPTENRVVPSEYFSRVTKRAVNFI